MPTISNLTGWATRPARFFPTSQNIFLKIRIRCEHTVARGRSSQSHRTVSLSCTGPRDSRTHRTLPPSEHDQPTKRGAGILRSYAAAALLDVPSFSCSDDFWFIYLAPAVARVTREHNQRPPVGPPPPFPVVPQGEQDLLLPAQGVEQEEQQDGDQFEQQCEHNDEGEDLLLPVLRTTPRPSFTTWRQLSQEGAVAIPELNVDLAANAPCVLVAVTQGDDYRWRGGELAAMVLYEYPNLIRRVPLAEIRHRQEPRAKDSCDNNNRVRNPLGQDAQKTR